MTPDEDDDHDDDHDDHDESDSCMNVTAGEVAPAPGTFTFSNGTTIDIETGDVAPEDGVYCIDEMQELMEIFTESDISGDGLLNASEFGYFFDAVMQFDDDDDDHDDHDDHDEGMCYNMATHEVNEDPEDVCEAYNYYENYSMGNQTFTGCYNMVTHQTNGDNQTVCEAYMYISQDDDDHDDHDEHNEDILGYAIIHVEAEGEYGFAHSDELSVFLMPHGGHDGHDDHDDHQGHDDHDDHDDHGDEDGHDDHGDEDAHDEDEEDLGSYDPHSWLDPVAVKTQTNLVLGHLITAFPAGEETFRANAEAFLAELDEIDAGFQAALADDVCPDKTVVANHNAYSYMAQRYDLQFLTVHGLDPEGEPSPEDVAAVVNHIKEEGLTVLFVEEYTDQDSVQSIVDQTGVEIKILYTMEMAPTDSNDDYLSLMNKNRENLVSGLGC